MVLYAVHVDMMFQEQFIIMVSYEHFIIDASYGNTLQALVRTAGLDSSHQKCPLVTSWGLGICRKFCRSGLSMLPDLQSFLQRLPQPPQLVLSLSTIFLVTWA